jgi:hypothetical protein
LRNLVYFLTISNFWLNVSDLIITIACLGFGGQELNPLIRFGFPFFFALKLIVTLIVTSALFTANQYGKSKEFKETTLYTVVVINNIYQLYTQVGYGYGFSWNYFK